MGIARVPKKKQIYAPPRRLHAKRTSGNTSRNPGIAGALKFMADVKAAGIPLYIQLMHMLKDFLDRGFHMGLITRAENMFEGHRDLLVDFNMFLPEDFQCTVPADQPADQPAEETK